MTTSELESRNVAISMRKSVENLVISSQDAIGQSISQAISFSGVITQPNQGLLENKNVSRSPSPSLRHTDSTLDITDNDKRSDKSDSSLQAQSLGNEVPVGIDIANLTQKDNYKVLTTPPASAHTFVTQWQIIGFLLITIIFLTKLFMYIQSSNSGSRLDGGTVRAKKKSWYNSLYPTYKSKCEDFKRLFKDLPDEERLIVDYSCAIQRDILVHGRLYASQSYLCFYASIFGWETSLTLRWKDVTAITKEKTALVIPNAILVCTESEKNFLTSFSGRDKAYLMLFRIWQNALMDQPISSQEIWQWVHTCYGEELGFDSDEDVPDAIAALDVPEEAVDSSMEVGGVGSGTGRGAADTPPLTNGDTEFRDREEEAGDTLPTDMSDTSDSEPDKHNNKGEDEKCTVAHEGKLLLQEEFPFNIDQLFTMIFTNSKFNLELLAARGTTDYVQAPWQPQNGLKCRQVNYTLSLTSGPMGPKEVHVTETQVMNKCSRPGAVYSINCTSENAGIPYADYFSVQAHYCLERRGDGTALALYGHVHYKKSMWPLVKAFLEKNAINGLEEFGRLLAARLRAAARPAPAPTARVRPRRRRRDAAGEVGGAVAPAVGGARAGGSGGVARWLLLALGALLLLNALLYWRLDRADRALDLDHLHSSIEMWSPARRMSSLSEAQAAQWARALERHSRRQRGQLLAWRAALERAVRLLAQTEQALAKLLETIKPVLERDEPETREDL
ncbi:protein Aster-B-like [Melitaea cinxia]|uniref:protein Aster-B-like n=1 Tax=Melitaea cinxia TaxID=113334 RepID=UPI001E2738F8|nr:protein Aster-B-like [Melitaea cinxia]